jgi:hypothetical protein
VPDRKALGELLGHERFAIAHGDDLATADPQDL